MSERNGESQPRRLRDEDLPPGKKYFTPKEAARLFHITENSLKGHRQRNHIEAEIQEEYTTLYSRKNLLEADIRPRKRGPKPKKKAQMPTQNDPLAAYVA